MRIRATFVPKVAGCVLGFGLLLLVMGSTCAPAQDGPPIDPGELAGVAAVYNHTDAELTVIAHGKTEDVTEVLQAEEAIFFEVRQSLEPFRFDFVQGSMTAHGELLVAGGGFLSFPSGLLTAGLDENSNELTVEGSSNLESFGGSRLGSLLGSLDPTKAVFLVVNDSSVRIGLTGEGGGGALRDPGQTLSVLIDQGETLTVEIRDFSEQGEFQLSHTFAPPISPIGDVSAFLTHIRVGAEGIEVQTREAKFRRLQ